jgi:hypothetical protein
MVAGLVQSGDRRAVVGSTQMVEAYGQRAYSRGANQFGMRTHPWLAGHGGTLWYPWTAKPPRKYIE